ncbi:MAG: filamentous hemagglutinin N-terminal domain-containing protein [Pleurocapsa sp. CRU_1_2]|nr:filamentous hemagglutinin N-terminal domain-containing protein [Pleurocapsa sp. CRU_1_2]
MFKPFASNFFLLALLSLLFPFPSSAQVVPDDTLGAESSEINSIDELSDAIEGGAIRGDNLFHSFQEFNVGERATVDFINPAGIENIFSRVTGGNISEIFGTLGVDGNANLFLINPNGIIFGDNISFDGGRLQAPGDSIISILGTPNIGFFRLFYIYIKSPVTFRNWYKFKFDQRIWKPYFE